MVGAVMALDENGRIKDLRVAVGACSPVARRLTALEQEMLGKPAILLVSGPLRPVLAKFASYGVERLHVLSYQEIPDNKQITIVASVGQ